MHKDGGRENWMYSSLPQTRKGVECISFRETIVVSYHNEVVNRLYVCTRYVCKKAGKQAKKQAKTPRKTDILMSIHPSFHPGISC